MSKKRNAEYRRRKDRRRRERMRNDPVYREAFLTRQRLRDARRRNDPHHRERYRLARRRRRLAKHGLDVEAFDIILGWQGGRCAICRCQPSKFMVDHDHKTNEVRGLLCYNCNVGLGHFRDSIERLQSAIEYLS